MTLRYLPDGGKLVDAGIVDQDIEPSVVLDGGCDDALGFRGLGDVATYGDSLAPGCSDRGYDFIRTSFAGSVIDDYRCAFSGEGLGDGGPDTLGSARNHCDFTLEFAHIRFLSKIRWPERCVLP